MTTLTDEQIDDFWLFRGNIHDGQLMPQLRDFARAIEAAVSAAPGEPRPVFNPAVVYVCEERDIECGRNQSRWCKSCPLAQMLPQGLSKSVGAPSPALREAAQALVDNAINEETVWPGHLKDLCAALAAPGPKT